MSTPTNVGSSARAVSHIFSTFGIISLLANAVLTGLFGLTFLNGALGVVLMLLFFDVAAVSWYCARQGSDLSGDQRAVAKIMSVATIIGSTLVSVVQVLDMANAISTGGWGHTFAIWLVTAFAAFNFIALFYYQFTSNRERQVDLTEEIAAQKADKINEMTKEAHDKAMVRANALLMQKTDVIAERIAADAERDYLRAMGCLDLFQAPEAVFTPGVKVDGAAAGAKKGKKKKTKRKAKASPATSAEATPETNPACSCGMPVGTGEGFCDYEIGGPGCMIDLKAAEEKAAREASSGINSEVLTKMADTYLNRKGTLDGFKDSINGYVATQSDKTVNQEEIDACISEMIAAREASNMEPLDLTRGALGK